MGELIAVSSNESQTLWWHARWCRQCKRNRSHHFAVLEFEHRVMCLPSVDTLADVCLEFNFPLVQDGWRSDLATFFQSIRQRKTILTRFAHLRWVCTFLSMKPAAMPTLCTPCSPQPPMRSPTIVNGRNKSMKGQGGKVLWAPEQWALPYRARATLQKETLASESNKSGYWLCEHKYGQ